MMEEKREDGSLPEEFVEVDLNIEVYLRARQDPIPAFTTFRVHKEHLDEGKELKDFMSLATGFINTHLDDRSITKLLFSDRRYNKQIFFTGEIQAISILAPDALELD